MKQKYEPPRRIAHIQSFRMQERINKSLFAWNVTHAHNTQNVAAFSYGKNLNKRSSCRSYFSHRLMCITCYIKWANKWGDRERGDGETHTHTIEQTRNGINESKNFFLFPNRYVVLWRNLLYSSSSFVVAQSDNIDICVYLRTNWTNTNHSNRWQVLVSHTESNRNESQMEVALLFYHYATLLFVLTHSKLLSLFCISILSVAVLLPLYRYLFTTWKINRKMCHRLYSEREYMHGTHSIRKVLEEFLQE